MDRSKGVNICDTLRDLLPFAQFKKCVKHLLRSVAFSKVASTMGVFLFFKIILMVPNRAKLLILSNESKQFE